MATEGERLARLEEQIHGIRDDVSALTAETARARDRLHKLEGASSLAVEAAKINRRNEAAQYRSLGIKIALVGLALALAAAVSPVVVVLLTGR